MSKIKRTLALLLSAALLATLTAPAALAKSPRTERSQFVTFTEMFIDGQRVKPSASLTMARTPAKFAPLLRLKRSFEPTLLQSAKNSVLR